MTKTKTRLVQENRDQDKTKSVKPKTKSQEIMSCACIPSINETVLVKRVICFVNCTIIRLRSPFCYSKHLKAEAEADAFGSRKIKCIFDM